MTRRRGKGLAEVPGKSEAQRESDKGGGSLNGW